MTLQTDNYEYSAIGQVFSCSGYNPEFRYRSIKVLKPAVFEGGADQWKLKQEGELELGEGEKEEH
jgi:hypothetical protein